MSTTTDRFSDFVDLVAQTLDEPETSGEDLAARLYLSRFHLTRLVTAVGGEAPSRFRRRLLLERAAYRLISSDRTVLDIAVESGYGSNEAFTRAFQRAYGASPRQWRASPRQIQLPSANDVHFHPPGGLRLPTRAGGHAMTLVTKMVEHHVWLVGQIVDRCARLADDQLDQPIRVSVDNEDGSMTLRSITSRLIGQMDMWVAAMQNREYDFGVEHHESLSSMRERLGRVGEAYLDQIRAVVDDGRLDETFVDALCEEPQVFTYGGMVAHVLTFAAYHRTLAVQRLVECGVDDLGLGDPMRWVAEPA